MRPHKQRPSRQWFLATLTLALLALQFPILAGLEPGTTDPADLYNLRLLAPSNGYPGQLFTARLKVESPYDHRPFAGVEVEALFKVNAKTFRIETRTDDRGEALLELRLPEATSKGLGKLKVKALRHGIERWVGSRFWIEAPESLLIHTDKKLYRPGQTLYFRALWFDDWRGARAGGSLDVEITDDDGRPVFQRQLVTSPFGIAHGEWAIPPGAPPGDYLLEVYAEGSTWEEQTVRIASYELPALRIEARPSREFFLPGQPVELQVEVESLVGEPVDGAQIEVRLLHEWEDDEDADLPPLTSGTADGLGQVTLAVDLAGSWEPLLVRTPKRATAYNRFRDLTLVVSATHPLSKRTETTRARLRLSRSPIHLYLIEEAEPPSTGLSADRFIVASYADGRPARCQILVGWSEGSEVKTDEAIIARLSTNRFGVARLALSAAANAALAAEGELAVTLSAWDSAGQPGKIDTRLTANDEEVQLQLKPSKALFKAGEPLTLRLASSEPIERVVLEVRKQGVLLESRILAPLNAAAQVTLASRDGWDGILDLSVYSLDPSPGQSGADLPADSARVIVLGSSNVLAVEVKGRKPQYRPGESAHLELVVHGDSQIDPSALGILVVDEAVRQRESETFGSFARAGLYLPAWEETWRTPRIAGIATANLLSMESSHAIPPDLELVAEALLISQDRPSLWVQENSPFGRERDEFRAFFSAQFKPIGDHIERLFKRPLWIAPRDAETATHLLAQRGIDLQQLRDPWGTPYRLRIERDGFRDFLIFDSAGWDRAWETIDDFRAWHWSWRWFTPWGKAIDRAARRALVERGVLLRSEAELATELAREGIVWESFKDPWGRPFRLTWDAPGHSFRLRINSAGPDGIWETEEEKSWDDARAWTFQIDYSNPLRRGLGALLARYSARHGDVPQDEPALRALFRSSGFELESWQDPWNHPFFIRFRQEKRYSDRVLTHFIQRTAQDGTTLYEPISDSLPVTEEVREIVVLSRGPDGQADTDDDQTLARYSKPLTSTEPRHPLAGSDESALVSARSGALVGRIMDDSGISLPGATVSVTHDATGTTQVQVTSTRGIFVFSRLAPGTYSVLAELDGFSTLEFPSISVAKEYITTVEIELIPALEERIIVTAESPNLNVRRISTGTTIAGVLTTTENYIEFSQEPPNADSPVSIPTKPAISTPRLRQDFPETLLWIPELLTDSQGRATLELPLADNVTTWRIEVLASTRDGQVAASQTEVVAVQPLYLEPDLPPFLTAGDRLRVPVLLHNLTGEPTAALLSASTEGGLSLAAPVRPSMQLEPGVQLLPIDIQARTAGSASLEVEAAGRDEGDAVRKETTVRADGRPVTSSVSRLLRGGGTLELEVPTEALTGSVSLEVRRYPDLRAHLLASTAALQARPTGCAEQTISKAFPSLLLSRLAQDTVSQQGELEPAELTRGKQFVNTAILALNAFQNSNGGYAYWRDGKSDLALSAYAVDFLAQASAVVTVDNEPWGQAIEWLLQQQNEDGDWAPPPTGYHRQNAEPSLNLALSAEIARVLASLTTADQLQKEQAERVSIAVDRALRYLAPRLNVTSRPYALAAFTLAAVARDDDAAAQRTARKLATLSHRRGNSLFWHLQVNTPFHGWGQAGRLETTALAIEALAAVDGIDNPDTEAGLAYLLENKATDGAWASTQATVRALRALVHILGLGNDSATSTDALDPARLLLDGRPLDESGVSSLLFASVEPETRSLSAGPHQLQLTGASSTSKQLLQATLHYSVAWDSPPPATDQAGQEELRYSVDCAPLKAKVGESVTCDIAAGRVGFRGYGMLIAEIGLPPGAEVDRAALERASEEQVDHWEVRPDRVIVYLWPRAAGSKFQISFRPRLAMEAKAYPSSLYDYYNPQARIVLAPDSFTVVGEPAP